MPKRVLSRLEVIKINELFKLHLVPAEREGFVKYQNGWDDAKIAQEIDPAIQAHSIGNLRTELCGKLDTTANTVREDNARVKELETLVQNLLGCYSNLEGKYNLLIDNLTLNKIANVKHLKTTGEK